MLLITVVGTLMANLATVVVVFGALALIKNVETCTVPPSELEARFSGVCPSGRNAHAPMWPLVWGLTIGCAVAVSLIIYGWLLRRRWQPREAWMGPLQRPPYKLPGWLWPRRLRDKPLSDRQVEPIRMAALVAQWAAVVYILGVVVIWVGLASGLQAG